MIWPPVPASSPTMIVPQGVRRTGSQSTVPRRIVSTEPLDSRMRWTPGCVVSSVSLQTIRCVGAESFGHRAIMSRLGPALAALVTTCTLKPFATVASERGSASAVLASTLSVEDCLRGLLKPNRAPAAERNWSSLKLPKSGPAAAAPGTTATDARIDNTPFRISNLLYLRTRFDRARIAISHDLAISTQTVMVLDGS